MADRRIVVDPVTRIEGHLRVQAVLGNGGKVITDSQSTGNPWNHLSDDCQSSASQNTF